MWIVEAVAEAGIVGADFGLDTVGVGIAVAEEGTAVQRPSSLS